MQNSKQPLTMNIFKYLQFLINDNINSIQVTTMV